MAEAEPPAAGLLASLRRLCSNGLALVQNRIELFAVELQEQKIRLVKLLLLTALTVFLGNTAVLVLTATVIILVGKDAHTVALISLSVFYTLAAIISGLLLRRELRSAPPPFADTVSELKKDCDCLNPPK